MKLKLVSDGTQNGTMVVNSETEEMLEGIYTVHFIAKANHVPYLIMKIWQPDVVVDVDTNDYEVYMTSNHKTRKEVHKFVPRKKDI